MTDLIAYTPPTSSGNGNGGAVGIVILIVLAVTVLGGALLRMGRNK